nr:hypothetical protein [Tanacetum cinerariifolium]
MYGYDGIPMLPVAPPSPNYIPGLEEPQTPPAPQDKDEHEPKFIQPHDPNFVLDPIYPEYIPLEDEHILQAEEQPLPPVVSPTAESPGQWYVAESDPEEDPEEYEDDKIEDGPVDYPMDRGYDGDDDDGNSSGYDADNEDEEEEDEEEEEEKHVALADSVIVIPTDKLVSPPEGTKPIIPPPSTDIATTGARITIRPQTFISLPPEAEVERLLAMPTPSPSPLTSLSPPFAGERLARCMALAALTSLSLLPSLYPPPATIPDFLLSASATTLALPGESFYCQLMIYTQLVFNTSESNTQREQHQTYSSQRHCQGSPRLLEDIVVSWDGYQLRVLLLPVDDLHSAGLQYL